MGLSADDVRNVLQLARLAATDEEVGRLRADLDPVLAYMERLRRVDVTGVEPLTHAGLASTSLRTDAAAGSLLPDEALSEAPDAHERHFRVPTVIDRGTSS